MELELGKTDDGKDRLDKAKDRLDTRTAEIGQAGMVEENAEVVRPEGEDTLLIRRGAKIGMEKQMKMMFDRESFEDGKAGKFSDLPHVRDATVFQFSFMHSASHALALSIGLRSDSSSSEPHSGAPSLPSAV